MGNKSRAAAEDKRKEEKTLQKASKKITKKRLFLIYCINVRGLTSREQRRHQSETYKKIIQTLNSIDKNKHKTHSEPFLGRRQRERKIQVLGKAPGRPASSWENAKNNAKLFFSNHPARERLTRQNSPTRLRGPFDFLASNLTKNIHLNTFDKEK